jgi:mannose-6-phosphate isomerase-like protein (cupin superfamily)
MLKIIDLNTAPTVPLGIDRGRKTKLVDASLGTESVDVHLNVLVPGGPSGQLHKHTHADNVYIVRSGEGELVVEGQTYVIRRDQVIFIPAGMKHSLSNKSDQPFEIFEIYAPAGDRFDFIACE